MLKRLAVLKGCCYDCGRPLTQTADRIEEYLVCGHCGELVDDAELITGARALGRRILWRWHSNTGDPLARGWRRRRRRV